MSLKHVWLIMQKDLRLFTKDRSALLFFIAFPFFFIVLFNVVLGGITGQDSRLELHVVTRETGGLSQQIIDAIETRDESQLKPGQPRIVRDTDYEQDRQAVEGKRLAGFLAFPADFTSGVMMGYGAQLEIVADPAQSNIRAALDGLARSIASEVGAQQVAREATVAIMVEQSINSGNFNDIGQNLQDIFKNPGDANKGGASVNFAVENIGDIKAGNPSEYVIPGYLVMFVFFGAALSAEVIVRERRNQTLERLLAGTVRKSSIIGGIFAGIAVKGLIQILIFWLVGILVFRIELGQSPPAVILLSILMIIVGAAFSVMLATFARTEKSAGAAAVITSIVLAPLGGSWWPLFILPPWMQSLAKITPHGWANTGFNKLMLFGGDFASVVPEIVALVLFALAFGFIALQRFRTSAV